MIIKLVNTASTSQTAAIDLKGFQPDKKAGTVQLLYSSNPAAFNKLSALENLKPEVKSIMVNTKKLTYELPASSVTVITIPYKVLPVPHKKK